MRFVLGTPLKIAAPSALKNSCSIRSYSCCLRTLAFVFAELLTSTGTGSEAGVSSCRGSGKRKLYRRRSISKGKEADGDLGRDFRPPETSVLRMADLAFVEPFRFEEASLLLAFFSRLTLCSTRIICLNRKLCRPRTANRS